MEGCEETKADWEKGWAWARYDPDKTNPEELVKAINEKTVFEAEFHKKTENKEKSRRGRSVIPNGLALLNRPGRHRPGFDCSRARQGSPGERRFASIGPS